MIGKLTGKIDSTTDDHCIVDVNGVGYVVFASAKTLGLLPAAGGLVSLLIETHVREDHIHLYGFASEAERQWFRTLTTVQGVGVKMALAILGVFTPEQLLTTIAAQDKKALTAVSGVGPKLAERIVTELKNQAAKMAGAGFAMPAVSGTATKGKAATKTPSAVEDALSALVHLGYSRTDAFTVVMRIQSAEPEASLDTLIRASLKELAA
ncbi:MAG: Holliday junction branch migration protein RuvA [Azospirillum brasilense]|nr:MAG: Holliday junction branch migration protein RuvA [Azospirillum brasilense]